MKFKLITTIAFCFTNLFIYAQGKEKLNLKHKFYLGAELGNNKMISLSLFNAKPSLQFGALAEYYFTKHWSLSIRAKCFKTGVKFDNPNFVRFWGPPTHYGTFNGAVVAVPINIKYNFNVAKKVSINFTFGIGASMETKSEYTDYSSNLSTDYPKTNFLYNSGIGLNYIINENYIAFITGEYFFGSEKGYIEGEQGRTYFYTRNELVNFGFKYCLKRKIKK